MAHFEQAGQSKGAAVVPIKAVAPAPKPTGRLPAGASCVTPACHTSMAAARHIHGPVSKNACDTCHADDIGGHKYPLLRDKTKMCTFCHAVSGTAPHQHKALEQGCTVCHDPHVSSVKYLIKGDSIDQVCASCHRVPWKRFTHTILTVGQCTVCHQPHQSDNAMLLLGGQGPGNCYLCHDGLRQQMASLPHVHKPAASQCVTCHSPHASDFANQLKAPIRQTCLSNACHDHDKLAKHLDSVSRPHEAVVTGHIKQMALTPTTTALTNFRNGEVNLHYVHVNREPKGRTCRTCHAVHGSDLPKHMASEVPFEGSNWSMPIKFDKTGTGGSCSPGCHEPLGYDRDHPRPRPATRPAGPTTTKGAR